jgi:hypothetical protein
MWNIAIELPDRIRSFELLDPENMGVAVEIASLSSLQAEI